MATGLLGVAMVVVVAMPLLLRVAMVDTDLHLAMVATLRLAMVATRRLLDMEGILLMVVVVAMEVTHQRRVDNLVGAIRQQAKVLLSKEDTVSNLHISRVGISKGDISKHQLPQRPSQLQLLLLLLLLHLAAPGSCAMILKIGLTTTILRLRFPNGKNQQICLDVVQLLQLIAKCVNCQIALIMTKKVA